jgi:glycerol kinase
MTQGLLLAIDQGTTSTRAFAFDADLRPLASATRGLTVRHPRPGWVEQDPDEILASVVESVAEVLGTVGGPARVSVAGLANQGETVVAWDTESGRALAPAIVWQCRRSEPQVMRLRAAGHEEEIRRLSGLPLDPYFSAGKMRWLLEEVPAVDAARAAGRLAMGTVDSWLTFQLGGEALTDASTASRTQLFDLRALDWSDALLARFEIPREVLARLVPTIGASAELRHERWGGAVPLAALVCDQQGALAGHACFDAGQMKATYGTGVFVLGTVGSQVSDPGPGLLATVAWRGVDGTATYAFDGGVLSAGSFLRWMTDELGILPAPEASDELAGRVDGSRGVWILPALSGIGAPWWVPGARGVIAGLTAAAGRAEFARAALDGIAHRVADVVEAMAEALGSPPGTLRVDGGLTQNSSLMQAQADLLGIPTEVATLSETTALGTAGLAGLAAGLLTRSTIASANPVARRLMPQLAPKARLERRRAWRRFVASASQIGVPMEGGG